MNSYSLHGQDIVYIGNHGITGEKLKEILDGLYAFAPTETASVNGTPLHLWTNEKTTARA